MKSLYLFACLFVITLGFSQNSEIRMSGAVVPSPYYYCNGQVFDLEVPDYASNATQSSVVEPVSVYNYIITDAAEEQDVTFNAPATATDKFSHPIDLGFNFNFFNSVYSRVVVGSNGRLVFTNDLVLDELSDTAKYIDRTFAGDRSSTIQTPGIQLPSPRYNEVFKNGDITRKIEMAQIFAGFTRLRINEATGSYKYKKANDGAWILFSFQSVIPHNGSGQDLGDAYTSYIILFKDGRIVVSVKDKTAGRYNAILGMQNEDGTESVIPPNNNAYNNMNWASASNDAFVITTGSTLTPTYLWELDRNNDGIPEQTASTRFFQNYTPVSDIEKLSVKITFAENSEVKTSQVLFKKLLKPQISAPDYTAGCGNPAKLSVIGPDPALTYRWRSETDPSFEETGTSITVGNGIYHVEVHSSNGSCTEKSATETVFINSNLPPFLDENQSIPVCDEEGNPSKSFNLAAITGYPEGPDYTVEYFEEGSSVAITSANLVSGQTKNFTIKVATKPGVAPACSFTKIFSVVYSSFPQENTVYSSEKLCLGTSSYSVQQFKNQFFSADGYEILFSVNGMNFSAASVNPTLNPEVWIKLHSAIYDCTTTVKLKFNFYPAVTANAPITQLPPQCSATGETFDLTSLIPEINASSDVIVTFHKSLVEAQTGTGEVPLAYTGEVGLNVLYIRVEDQNGCVSADHPSIDLLVYPKPNLLVAAPIVLTNCPDNTKFNLTQNATALTDAAEPVTVELQYYAQDGTPLTGSSITFYDAAVSGSKPFIKIIYNPTCYDIVEFDLTYHSKPVAAVDEILICGETSYPLGAFKAKVVTNPSDYTFTAEDGSPLPLSFVWSSLPHLVKFYVINKNTGCSSDIQTVTFVQGEPTPLLKPEIDFILCERDFDGKVEFDLNSKKSIFSADSSATFEYFRDAAMLQPIETMYTNEIAFKQTVFVRITTVGYCPAMAQINLLVNIPALSSTLKKEYFICYGETLRIDAGAENDSIVWSDGQTGRYANFSAPGAYSVTLKNGGDGCAYTHDFIISDENQPKISLINQTNHSIEVIAGGGKIPYTYYFNGKKQSSNVLTNPTDASYKIQVQSEDGCMGPPKMVYFIKINNAFTPNGDGINEVWKIEQLDKMQQVSVLVVDRHGTKFFESTNPNFVQWDGKMGGKPAPTGTYWYTVSWYDPVTQKTEQRQGWVLLKNRQ